MAELWDLFDGKGKHMGTMRPVINSIPQGMYHKTVEVIIVDGKGHMLLTKRAWGKNIAPGRLEFTAGSVLAGETPKEAAYREVREETGLELEKIALLQSVRAASAFVYIYLGLVRNLTKAKIRLQPEETIGYQIVTYKQWLETLANNTFNTSRLYLYRFDLVKMLPKLLGELPADEQTEEKEEEKILPVPTFRKTAGLTVSEKANHEESIAGGTTDTEESEDSE